MNDFGLRFEQKGGMYQTFNESVLQTGGAAKVEKDLSPTSNNWKKKYLEIISENDNLKTEISKLKKKIKQLESQ